MPYKMSFSKTSSYGGRSFSKNTDVLADGQYARSVSVPAAKTGGTLTGRTDNDTGIITMPAGHGIITADKVDIFWNVGGVLGSRQGMTATVAGNAITVDAGQGDNLPALNTTNISMMKPTTEDFVVTGDNVKAYVAGATAPGWVIFLSGASAILKTVRLVSGTLVDDWNNVNGGANPFAGLAIAKVSFSHGEAAAQTMTAAVLIS
jgi:hypothetical protein